MDFSIISPPNKAPGLGQAPSCSPSRLAASAVALAGALVLATDAVAAPPAGEVNVTKDPNYRWGESFLAVNPKNPNNIVLATVGVGFTYACQKTPDCQTVNVDFGAGRPFPQPRGMFAHAEFNRVYAFTTFDGGKTWSRHEVPLSPAGKQHLNGTGDPFVTATANGDFYFSFDDNDWGTPEHPLPSAGVAISKSTDGGRTWSQPVLGGTPVDGPKIISDLSTGTIYVASSGRLGKGSTGDPNAPPGTVQSRWIASSKDGARWTAPQPSGSADSISMSAAIGVLATGFRASNARTFFGAPNAELCGEKPAPCTVFETSSNGGASWTRRVVDIPSDYPGGIAGVLVAADPSRKGHFALATPAPGEGGYRVYQTRDSGVTWSGPVMVTEDASKPHFHGWLAFSPQGALGVIWRTRQAEPGKPGPTQGEGFGLPPTPYDVWAAVSRDGGRASASRSG